MPDHTAWCAGYPRSGTSLVRLILAHCFGHRTASVYNESRMSAGYMHAVRGVPSSGDLEAFQLLGAQQGWLFWKTHSCLTDVLQRPAIVIVRDGRRVLQSLKHFLPIYNFANIAMRDLILGHHPWGSWSRWVRSWEEHAGDKALWLRYENVVADVPGTVDRIASAFGLVPIAQAIPSFDALHAAEPNIWRAGDAETNGGMSPEDEALFWTLHGAAMGRHGYSKGSAALLKRRYKRGGGEE